MSLEKEIIDADEIMPEAPLTSSQKTIRVISHYKFGRDVIKIPLSAESVNEQTIAKYLQSILTVHNSNVSDYLYLEDVYKGKSNIWNKIRRFSTDKKNTIVNENHAFYMVEFKKGQLYGNDIQYSVEDESVCSEEIRYLNRYMKDQDKLGKNIEMAENVFKLGNSIRFVIPAITSKDTNLEKKSPYEIYDLDNKNAFVVYSSIFHNKKLFGGIITEIDSPDPDKKKYEIMIYDKFYSYQFTCYGKQGSDAQFVSKQRHYIGHIPFVEYYTNKSRMGLVELVESILNAVNDISSDSIDAINDWVNSILAIYNMDIDRETKKQVDDAGAISLKTVDPTRPADAKYLVNQLQQADVMTRYETLVKVAYNIAGVPLPTTKSTSGGDTGVARELGGGHTNADIVASQQEVPLKQADKAMLDICLEICKKTPRCPIKELSPCDIDVNFSRKKNYNLLVKTESLKLLIDMGMPEEIALNIVDLTANNHEVAKMWKENREKLLETTEINR